MSDDRTSLIREIAAKGISRRGFLGLAGATSLSLTFTPLCSLAQQRPPECHGHGPYDAMVLSCIDPRLVDQVYYYMQSVKKANCMYSQFVIAGAAIGVMAPKFETWHAAFWDNLATSMSLHKIKKIVAIDHRDCGAAKIAYGEKSIADPATETATHKKVLADFRKEVNHRHPGLEVVTGLMALDGKMEIFSDKSSAG